MRPCPLCQVLGRTGVLVLRQINIDEAIYVCTDNQCFYPVAVGTIESELVKRHISEWEEQDTIEQVLEKNACNYVPNGTDSTAGHNEVKHTSSMSAHHQPSDLTHLAHDYHTPDFSHQRYNFGYPPNGHYQLYDHSSIQNGKPDMYNSPHQAMGHDSALGDTTYSQMYLSYGQHFNGTSHQAFGTAPHHTTGQYGWSAHSLGNQAGAHISYPGNQPADDTDSFIDSLFQS